MSLKLDIYFWYFIGYKEVLCEKVAYVFFNEKIEIHFVLSGCNRTKQHAILRNTKVLVLFNNSSSKLQR